MSFFSTTNDDAKFVDPAQVSNGPRVGFTESFAASYDAQRRTSAQSGMWAAFADEEDAQLAKARAAGIKNMPRIGIDMIDLNVLGPDSDFFRYKEASKYYSGLGDEDTARRLSEYDKRIEELKQQYPDLGLMSGRDLFDSVVKKGRDAEARMQNQRRTFGGAVGDFIGGAVASLNPRTDNLNFLTLGVGGAGKTAAMRIATEAGAQGVIEGLNQLTGVQQQREMMGLSSGFTDAATRVAGTALIGGVVQGAGESIYAAGKRWFSDNPPLPSPVSSTDPAKEPLLLEYKPSGWKGQDQWEKDLRDYQQQVVADLMNGTRDYTDDILVYANPTRNRQMDARARMDIDHVTRSLERWDSENPVDVKPRTSTSIPSRVAPAKVELPDINIAGSSVDAIARKVDPKLFNVYDSLADRKTELRRWLEDPRYKREQDAAVQKATQDIEA